MRNARKCNLFIWMFHSRSINAYINKLHFRALHMVYRDYVVTFEELLNKDNSVNIHQQNLQSLAIEMYKVDKEVSPNFMTEIFPIHPNTASGNISANTRAHSQFYNSANPKEGKHGSRNIKKSWAKNLGNGTRKHERCHILIHFQNED